MPRRERRHVLNTDGRVLRHAGVQFNRRSRTPAGRRRARREPSMMLYDVKEEERDSQVFRDEHAARVAQSKVKRRMQYHKRALSRSAA